MFSKALRPSSDKLRMSEVHGPLVERLSNHERREWYCKVILATRHQEDLIARRGGAASMVLPQKRIPIEIEYCVT